MKEPTPAQVAVLQLIAEGKILHFAGDIATRWLAESIRTSEPGEGLPRGRASSPR